MLWPAFPITIAALTAFFLPLSVLPAEARADGTPTTVAALTSAAFLAGVVTGELVASAALNRLGPRRAIVVGLTAMAIPTALVTLDMAPAMTAGLSAIRGMGFALVAVATAALVAHGSKRADLGRTLGWYGLAAGVPSVAALPLGVLFAAQNIPEAGMLVAAGAAACGIPFAFLLPLDSLVAAPRGLRSLLARASATRQAGALALGATASGALIAYAPVVIAPSDPVLAAAMLLLTSVAATVARLPAGRLSDRVGPARLIAPALIVATAGVGLCAGTGWVLPTVGAVGVGLGFGALQNATLHAMSTAAPVPLLGAVSALWNLAYDVGLLAGALIFAAIAAVIPSPAIVPALALCLAVASAVVIKALRPTHALDAAA